MHPSLLVNRHPGASDEQEKMGLSGAVRVRCLNFMALTTILKGEAKGFESELS